MINVKPDVILSGRYTQADVARILDIDRHSVRRYEQLGLICFRMKTRVSRKVTTGTDIVRLWEKLN